MACGPQLSASLLSMGIGFSRSASNRINTRLIGVIAARYVGVESGQSGFMHLAKSTVPKPSGRRAAISARFALAAIAVLVGTVVEAQPSAAETLLDALAGAYQYSPTIDAERARQRARDEDIARAESGYRPDISATSTVGRQQINGRSFRNSSINSVNSPRGWSVDLVQPVFRGFQTTNAVNATEAYGSGRARDTKERRTAGIARCCNGIRRCRA